MWTITLAERFGAASVAERMNLLDPAAEDPVCHVARDSYGGGQNQEKEDQYPDSSQDRAERIPEPDLGDEDDDQQKKYDWHWVHPVPSPPKRLCRDDDEKKSDGSWSPQ
jgi:hypothetical protein